MKRCWSLLSLLGLLLSSTLLAGCLTSVPLEVKVNQSHNGSAITLQQGQELTLELSRQSSAYAWYAISQGSQVLGNPRKKTLGTDQSYIIDQYTFTALFVGDDQVIFEERLQNNNASPSIVSSPSATNRTFTLNIRIIK